MPLSLSSGGKPCPPMQRPYFEVINCFIAHIESKIKQILPLDKKFFHETSKPPQGDMGGPLTKDSNHAILHP
jgi:hypothetical protein